MINIDEHLEELEEGFGDDLLKNDQKQSAGTIQSQVKKPEVIKPPSIFTPWLNPQKTETPKKSRWSSVTSSSARADNIIAAVTGKFYGGLPPPKPLPKTKQQFPQPTYQQPANMMMPPSGFMSPPMFGMPPMSGMPGMPPLPFPPTSIPSPSIVTPPKLSSVERDRSSRHRSPRHSPRRSSRRSRSRSPRRSYRSRSPPRRSPETSLDGVPIEDSMDEENELFAKLLLKKLQAIRSRRRLESLHVDIMSMVKKAVDEETSTDTNRRNL